MHLNIKHLNIFQLIIVHMQKNQLVLDQIN